MDDFLAMAVPLGLDTHVRMLVQRQWSDPAAIELLFAQVTRLVLSPPPENHDAIIRAATFLVRPDGTYWADVGDWTPEESDRECTWVASQKLFWRQANEYLGEALRYGPGQTP
ncbi:MAG: hypothetical protein ACOC8A_02145 [bacterium]